MSSSWIRIPRGYLRRLLAGAVFGLYMAHLLYYLNPQIRISQPRLLGVTLLYAVLCGLVFGSILWVLRLVRLRLFPPAERKPHGFGLIVFSAFFSGFVYWAHLSTLRIYLPRGTTRALSNAATLIGITAFLLFLLWLIERNAGRPVSNAILLVGCLLVALSAFFLHHRRESYRTETREAVVATVRPGTGDRHTIVVAIQHLPHDWIVRLAAEAGLPWIEGARTRGYFARLETFPTASDRAIWASLATGKLPYRHGVTGRYSYRTLINAPTEEFLILPKGLNFRRWGLLPPVERIAAPLPAGRSLPVWGIFERLGLRTVVINWPSTTEPEYPTSQWVPESAFLIDGSGNRTHDERHQTRLQQARNAASEISERFPALAAIQNMAFASALTSDVAAAETALEAASRHDWALILVSLNGLDAFYRSLDVGENELPLHASPEGHALRGYIGEVDRLLARISDRFPEADLFVVSPSGPDPRQIPADILDFLHVWLTREEPGSADGFVLATGGQFAPRESAPIGETVDFVPTLLFAAGLPVARDMDGRVITELFTEEALRSHTFSLIPSYEVERLIVAGMEE